MIEIVDYKVVLNKSVYAEFTIYITKFDLEIGKCREFRMVGDKGPRRWFSFHNTFDEDVKLWKPTVKFRLKATEDTLWSVVQEAVDKHLEENPDLEVKAQSFNTATPELPF